MTIPVLLITGIDDAVTRASRLHDDAVIKNQSTPTTGKELLTIPVLLMTGIDDDAAARVSGYKP